ncbi:hypothetical protein L1049_023957 [Liquidambar formosana]|uniref:Uncharacterized protein n=1 Tax=Liquidambar formosana TaxID=63359 RepID=A0AAP0S149_LIQFO
MFVEVCIIWYQSRHDIPGSRSRKGLLGRELSKAEWGASHDRTLGMERVNLYIEFDLRCRGVWGKSRVRLPGCEKARNGPTMELGRSFRLQRDSSLKRLARSNSSLLVSESISSECSRITSYQRLSESMRLTNEYSSHRTQKQRKSRAWGFLTKMFSFKKTDGADEIKQGQVEVEVEVEAEAEAEAEAEKKKRRSSWLPNPKRRWPVQGW